MGNRTSRQARTDNAGLREALRANDSAEEAKGTGGEEEEGGADPELGALPAGAPRLATAPSLSQQLSAEARRVHGSLRLGSLLGSQSQVRETFYCLVCMENVDAAEGVVLRGDPCAHRFCRGCLGGHLAARVADGQVENPCPSVGNDGCGNFATEEDVKDLCEPEIVEKHAKFKKMKQSSDFRECPYAPCTHMQKGSRWFPKMTCENCKKQYCFFHSNAHEGMSCREYAATDRFKEEVTTEVIKKTTKQCPSCKAPTEKNGGCNHMTCANPSCKFQWCWLCLKEYQPDHYNANNSDGCPGGQFADPDTYNSRLDPLLARIRAYQLGLAGLAGLVTILMNFAWILAFWGVALLIAAGLLIWKKATGASRIPDKAGTCLCFLVYLPPLLIGLFGSFVMYLVFATVWLLLFCLVYVLVLPYSLWKWHSSPELHREFWLLAKGGFKFPRPPNNRQPPRPRTPWFRRQG